MLLLGNRWLGRTENGEVGPTQSRKPQTWQMLHVNYLSIFRISLMTKHLTETLGRKSLFCQCFLEVSVNDGVVGDFLIWWLMRKQKEWPESEMGRTLKGLLLVVYFCQGTYHLKNP